MALIEHCWASPDAVERMLQGQCPIDGCGRQLLPTHASAKSAAAGACPLHGAFSLRQVFNRPGLYALMKWNYRAIRPDPR